jgi:hypothetical protein
MFRKHFSPSEPLALKQQFGSNIRNERSTTHGLPVK